MICLLCPKCQKVLSVSEEHRGGVGQCPGCGQKFRIPAAVPQPALVLPTEDAPPLPPPEVSPPRPAPGVHPDNRPRLPAAPDPLASVSGPLLTPEEARRRVGSFPDFDPTPSQPEPPTVMVKFQSRPPAEEEYETLELDDDSEPEEPGYEIVADVAPPPIPLAEEPAAVRAAPLPVVPLAEDDEPDVPARDLDEDRPRRRRRRRPGFGFSLPAQLVPGVGNFLALMAVLGALWVLLACVALLLPPLGVLLVLLGGLVALVGNVWFLIVAFQDDFVNGLLCLLVPIWALLFLINNQDTAGRPFLVGLVGTLMVATGLGIAGRMWG